MSFCVANRYGLFISQTARGNLVVEARPRSTGTFATRADAENFLNRCVPDDGAQVVELDATGKSVAEEAEEIAERIEGDEA